MTGKQTTVLAVLAAMGLGLASGCIAVGGRSTHDTPTLGRQLIDLKQARDVGAIDDAEFDAARARLLARDR